MFRHGTMIPDRRPKVTPSDRRFLPHFQEEMCCRKGVTIRSRSHSGMRPQSPSHQSDRPQLADQAGSHLDAGSHLGTAIPVPVANSAYGTPPYGKAVYATIGRNLAGRPSSPRSKAGGATSVLSVCLLRRGSRHRTICSRPKSGIAQPIGRSGNRTLSAARRRRQRAPISAVGPLWLSPPKPTLPRRRLHGGSGWIAAVGGRSRSRASDWRVSNPTALRLL